MKNSLWIMALGITGLLFSACATTQNIDQICATPNLQKAADTATKRMARDARPALRALNKSSGVWEKNVTPAARDVVQLGQTLEDLRARLKQGRGMYRLKALAKMCAAPNLTEDNLSQFFEDQNLPENLVQTIKALPVYTYMIDSPPEHWRPSEVRIDVPLPRMEDF